MPETTSDSHYPISIYAVLGAAYDALNEKFFECTLDPVLFTLTRKHNMLGYFKPRSVKSSDGEIRNEIAINPDYMLDRPLRAVLSTILHEMCHAHQSALGNNARRGYHDKRWGEDMKRCGLHPSHTGATGGKEVGQQMSHYEIEAGGFSVWYETSGNKYEIEWGTIPDAEIVMPADANDPDSDEGPETDSSDTEKKTKTPSKVKYCCTTHKINIWAKPETEVMCPECIQAGMTDAKNKGYRLEVAIDQILINSRLVIPARK